ncbi:MAG TPA: hypothetical protein PKD00_06860 [Burkholderiales bacterium]|nr:hypothetical protein [Burkholderiales bacterium]
MTLQKIYADETIGFTDLKRGKTNFIDTFEKPIALLKRDEVKGYLIPTKLMAYFMEHLEDMELADIANQRLNELETGKSKTIKINLNDL